MKTESAQRERTPVEIWDQLAISEVKKQLAPNGFKKIHNGKREVTTSQFLTKQTVITVCAISANLIRLYRENLRDRLNALIKERDQWRVEAEAKRKACRFWQFKKKRQIRDDIMSYAGAGGMGSLIIMQLDEIKPSMPKISKGKRKPEKA